MADIKTAIKVVLFRKCNHMLIVDQLDQSIFLIVRQIKPNDEKIHKKIMKTKIITNQLKCVRLKTNLIV